MPEPADAEAAATPARAVQEPWRQESIASSSTTSHTATPAGSEAAADPATLEELAATLSWRALLAPRQAFWPPHVDRQYREHFAPRVRPVVGRYPLVSACINAAAALLALHVGALAEAMLQLAPLVVCNVVAPWVARHRPWALESVFLAWGLCSAGTVLAMGLGLFRCRLMCTLLRFHPVGGPVVVSTAVLIYLASNRHVGHLTAPGSE